jgi:hypothetical protein
VRPVRPSRLIEFRHWLSNYDWFSVYSIDVLPNVTPSQYGGLAGSPPTTLALFNLLHNWYQALDQPHTIIRVLFLDFTKAFDLINHNKLLHDMQRMGVREALIPWIASYLKPGRKQMTKVGNVKSELNQVNGGVPQGSKIGPLALYYKNKRLGGGV